MPTSSCVDNLKKHQANYIKLLGITNNLNLRVPSNQNYKLLVILINLEAVYVKPLIYTCCSQPFYTWRSKHFVLGKHLSRLRHVIVLVLSQHIKKISRLLRESTNVNYLPTLAVQVSLIEEWSLNLWNLFSSSRPAKSLHQCYGMFGMLDTHLGQALLGCNEIKYTVG